MLIVDILEINTLSLLNSILFKPSSSLAKFLYSAKLIKILLLELKIISKNNSSNYVFLQVKHNSLNNKYCNNNFYYF